MKMTQWICWLFAVCVCLAAAKNNIRRPLTPLYPNMLILKKPRPIGHRISMGNAIHIGNNLSYQRLPYKHPNRIRWPAMYVSPTNWKNQIPARATLNNRAILPQRVPAKEFHTINKIPEFSAEYRPELVVLPATHRGGIDDDKGPIHTIPAPNLSPADKPYGSVIKSTEKIADRRPYSNDINFRTTVPKPNIGLATIGSGLSPQKIAMSTSLPQHQYEVTENNNAAILKEHQTIQPATLQPQDLEIMKLYSTAINSHLPNEIFMKHPVNTNTGVVEPNVQFSQSNLPMQTNLHSSLRIGFPPTAIQTPYIVAQQIPTELQVVHPAPTEPQLSATQLYDLLNSFPHKVAEQYTPDQQHILQQQLGQIFQPDAVASFSQPQMHSFNYDEQANQLQQQQISLDQNYALEGAMVDPGSSLGVVHKQNDNVRVNEEFAYSIDGAERSENNIEYEETKNPTKYVKQVSSDDTLPTKFYTTLPNREAAEKLAALAAAGNVNSRLIGQLRKQQEENNNLIPFNHKNDDNVINQQRNDGDQLQEYNRYNSSNISQQQRQKQNYKIHDVEKLSVQGTIIDEADRVIDDQQSDIRKDNVEIEYEYENEDGEIEDSQFSNGKITSHNDDSHFEFGSRLRSKTRE